MTNERGTVYASYTVRYRPAGSDIPFDLASEARVNLITGYSTFESIRTILAVKLTGRQEPDLIEVLRVLSVPTEQELDAVNAALTAHQEFTPEV